MSGEAVKLGKGGCPMCDRRHHPGTTVGFTGMNRTCYKKWTAKQKRLAKAQFRTRQVTP